MKLLYTLSLLIVLATSCQAQTAKKKKLSDDQLLTLVEKQTFNYFWDGAEIGRVV